MTIAEHPQSQIQAPDFFSGVAQSAVAIGVRTFRAPVFYQDLSLDAYVFACDRRAALAFLPSPQHAPVSLPFDKVLAALMCFEYRATDVEPYNEVALCLPLAAYGSPLTGNLLSGLFDFARHTMHAHILHLPVDTELALEGGVQHFGYPKFLAGISYTNSATMRMCELQDAEQKFLLLRVSRRRNQGIALGRRELRFHSYPVLGGRQLRATFDLQFDDLYFNPIGKDIRLETSKIVTLPSDNGQSISY